MHRRYLYCTVDGYSKRSATEGVLPKGLLHDFNYFRFYVVPSYECVYTHAYLVQSVPSSFRVYRLSVGDFYSAYSCTLVHMIHTYMTYIHDITYQEVHECSMLYLRYNTQHVMHTCIFYMYIYIIKVEQTTNFLRVSSACVLSTFMCTCGPLYAMHTVYTEGMHINLCIICIFIILCTLANYLPSVIRVL